MTQNEPKWKTLAAVLVVAAWQARAQESPELGRRIVISIPDRKLALVENGRVVKVYATAVGAAESPTPAGEFQIINSIPKPTWYTRNKVVGPGKENPLGTRWLGLSRKGYGIHGTNVPSSIGKAASHGCIRMRNQDVEDLFTRVEVGDTVEMHDTRNERVSEIFGSVEPQVIASARVQ